jgi:hypothetical protein
VIAQHKKLASIAGSGESQAPLPGPHRIAYSVGGISFGVSSNGSIRLALDPGLAEFSVFKALCDIEFTAGWTNEIHPPSAVPAFASGGLWTAYREASGTSLYFSTQYLGEMPYKKCWFNDQLTAGSVSLLSRYFDPQLPVYPLEYPLDELLMIHRLCKGEGVEIHASGVLTADGTGRLFVGHSGAGKSTASRLWLQQPCAKVLSDDRIILRLIDGAPVMFGTPWHGDAGLAEQASAPLHRIFLLHQAQSNEIVALPPARAAAELFARTFVPYHHAPGLDQALQFLQKLTAIVPVAILRCTPDARAIQEVLRAA